MEFDYQKHCREWQWTVPEYYNIGRDCTDKYAEKKSHSEKIALYWENEHGETEKYTFSALSRISNQIGNALLSLGLRKGERLIIRLPNLPQFPLIFLGAVKIGVVPVPTSTMLTSEELEYIILDSGSEVLVTTPEFYEEVDEQRRRLPSLREVLILGTPLPPGCVDFTRLIEKSSYEINVPITKADDPAYICYTSGTTGFPKGVIHAQRALIGHDPSATYWQALRPDDVVMHAGELNWTYTLGTGCLDPWRKGCTTLIYGGGHKPKKFLELITKYRVDVFMAVPTVYRQMLRAPDDLGFDLSSLRHSLSAGEHLTEELFNSWKDKFGIELYDGLGMSEFSYYVSNMPGMPIKPGSPGKPQPGHRSKLIDERGKEVEVGETGVLATPKDDPGIMLKYWRKSEETGDMFRGDWFVSGDFFYRDEDGYLWLVGRQDDVITTMGFRVSPFEVERVLNEHRAIAECAAVGIDVGEGKTITTAFIVLKDGTPETDRLKVEVSEYSAKRLARYKCPREIVFIDSLSKTANGKIKRNDLKDKYNRAD